VPTFEKLRICQRAASEPFKLIGLQFLDSLAEGAEPNEAKRSELLNRLGLGVNGAPILNLCTHCPPFPNLKPFRPSLAQPFSLSFNNQFILMELVLDILAAPSGPFF